MINKAMIEIPPKFAGQPPVNPDSKAKLCDNWTGAQGLAEDVRYYGEWMKKKAFEKIGHLYPKVKDEHGQEHTVIAWIWARTVKSPDPMTDKVYVPIVSSLMLSTKKDRKAWVEIVIDSNTQEGWRFEVKSGDLSKTEETIKKLGTKAGKAKDFICCLSNSPIQRNYIQDEGKANKLSKRLMAIVAEGKNGRIYLPPNQCHENIATKIDDINIRLARESFLSGSTPTRAMITGGVCSAYGLKTWGHLFTDRQLMALTTLSELVIKAQEQVIVDGGSKEYANAIGTYLAFTVDKIADRGSSVCSWDVARDGLRNTFGRQAIPMAWDYAEGNIFSNSSGCFDNTLDWIVKVINLLPANQIAVAKQSDAQSDNGLRNIMVSTDPPYYDNIGYAILSDFFYVWLRNSLKNVYPDLLGTMLVPKAEELVATPYRFEGGISEARKFFEDGMLQTFKQINTYSCEDIPTTVYYAYKQSETESDSTSSTGWETMLSAIVLAGFSITGTWPMRTEMANRAIASGSNALASSIVLVCRKRPADAPVCSRRDFVNALKKELKPALEKLQASNIAPVDLQQSALGPGMGVYSRYSQIVEADGTPMSVRSALQIINQELDAYFTEQDGDLDRDSSFCVWLYTHYEFGEIKFGDANTNANAKNTSIDKLKRLGILYAEKGVVRLLIRDEISDKIDDSSISWLLTQQLTHAMEKGGVQAVAKMIADMGMFSSNAERAKALAYRLFTIADRKHHAQEAFVYNSLVIAWPEIQEAVARIQAEKSNMEQLTFE
jgi:putative DNA methylase